ncbi:iron-sulfur cluster repair di-iron protein [Ornithobacterium rhinotracheale]|uniref:Iron-sulfur cluster repair di-iron protein n=1 Tax=Ornithobacterium rhinotracheale TaxID=28251 RepID=A0A410JP98_ORNRH|nr:iron-sulfur cluster repair di-iron protein [Ornithobacterium rhinotracheale]QAR29966.1 iron-sulfur cluster repair di-iron protein [Ornithobacterium rhinotracheale]
MENLNPKTIGEFVAEDFRTAAVFKKYKIDFCCRGGRALQEVCEQKNLNYEQILEDLAKAKQKNAEGIDFKSFPLDLLADYIEKTHHRYVEDRVPVLLQFLNKLCRVHGERHPELLEIDQEFKLITQELAEHFMKEEQVLFPFIRQMVAVERSGEEMPHSHFGTVENPIAMMKQDHENAGEIMAKIATLTDQYTPPADACSTYKVTFAMLQEFEEDLHKHIHLENNILFPSAIKLENKLRN